MSSPEKPLRQVGVGQKLAPERDQIRLTLAEPGLGGVVIEPTSQDQRSAIFSSNQIEHTDLTRVGLYSFFKGSYGWIDKVQVGQT